MMKRITSIITVIVISLALVSGTAFAAKVWIAAGGKPKPHKKVVIKKGPHKGIILKKGPYRGTVIKKGPRKVVVVKVKRKRLYYPKKKIVIAGKPFSYRPWKWRGRIRVIKADVPLRAHPHHGAAIIKRIPKGNIYQVLSRYGNWYLIRWQTKTWYGGVKAHQAWINADAINVLEVEEVKAEEGEDVEEAEVEVEEEIEVEDAEVGEEVEIVEEE